MALDVRAIRTAYPALRDGYAYLDGAAGTQVPESVIEAIAAAYRGGIGNAGGAFPASGRSDAIVAAARLAVADGTEVTELWDDRRSRGARTLGRIFTGRSANQRPEINRAGMRTTLERLKSELDAG